MLAILQFKKIYKLWKEEEKKTWNSFISPSHIYRPSAQRQNCHTGHPCPVTLRNSEGPAPSCSPPAQHRHSALCTVGVRSILINKWWSSHDNCPTQPFFSVIRDLSWNPFLRLSGITFVRVTAGQGIFPPGFLPVSLTCPVPSLPGPWFWGERRLISKPMHSVLQPDFPRSWDILRLQ